MPQPRSRRPRDAAARVLVAAAALAIGLSAIPPPLGVATARAATKVPGEPGAFRIDGPAYAAITADLDGDGRRELIRITNWGIDQSRMAVEVWRQAPDGSWTPTGNAAQVRRGRSVNEALQNVPADAENMRAVLTNDQARLLLWRQGGRDRVLAIVNSNVPAGDESPCCLTIWEVTLPGPNSAPQLKLLIDTQRGGDVVYAVDMDGDGTQELAIHEPPGAGGGFGAFIVLRWVAGRFIVLSRPLDADLAGTEVVGTYRLGDSDGLPGDEIGMVSAPFRTGFGLTRFSLRSGVIRAERAEVPGDGVPLTVPPNAGRGAGLIMYGGVDRPLDAFLWPAGGQLRQLAESSLPGRPVGVIGSGDTTRVLVQRLEPPALDLIAPDLTDASRMSVRPADASKPFFAGPDSPYLGPWGDRRAGGAAAQVFGGTLIEQGASGQPTFGSMAVLPGMAPIGTLGRASAWMALAQRTTVAPTAAAMDPQGGSLLSDQSFEINLVPTSQVLTPESDGGVLQPALQGAVLDAHDPSGASILIGKPVFHATVAAPDGSLAQSGTDTADRPHLLTTNPNAGGILGPPFEVPITSPPASGGNEAFDATLQVITPSGHGYTARWHVRLLQDPPKLTAEGSFLSLGFAATVSGQTDSEVTVSVDGHVVRPGSDGRYRIDVPAGLFPRDVRVVARDAIGHVTTVTASIVAPVDYRRLPWIPIVVVLTLAAAGFLFVRAPRSATRIGGGGDEGSFEEIDAD